jgi:rRNA maturation RNase YbeY
VSFVGDNFMERFGHGKTDVLAFPYDDKSRGSSKIMLGDVLINVEYVRRTRMKRQWSSRTEELLVHALVHLAGYTHDDFKSYNQMRQTEIRILGRPCLPSWDLRAM